MLDAWTAPSVYQLMRRLLLAVITLLSAPLLADCIANGHYTIGVSKWPYTEDLMPVSEPQTIRFDDALQWTKIQGGCPDFDEQNIRAAAPVNVLLRASFNIAL